MILYLAKGLMVHSMVASTLEEEEMRTARARPASGSSDRWALSR